MRVRRPCDVTSMTPVRRSAMSSSIALISETALPAEDAIRANSVTYLDKKRAETEIRRFQPCVWRRPGRSRRSPTGEPGSRALVLPGMCRDPEFACEPTAELVERRRRFTATQEGPMDKVVHFEIP